MGVKLLGKIKVYEFAKQMNMESKKLMEIASKNGIEVKSHLSSITDEECEKLFDKTFFYFLIHYINMEFRNFVRS